MKGSSSATEELAQTLAKGPDPTAPVRDRPMPPHQLVLNRYRLHRRLGTGGFGTVWLARDERLDRDVAVKVLPRQRIVGGRFEREARAAARLSHPGIVTLYEAAVDADGAYLVSELVRGDTLDSLLHAGRRSDRDLVEIGIALCDALSHAHSQAVVHRDVKPSNVLVPELPATPEQAAKLTDFGIARVVGGDTLTRTGDVLGTAAYMAPEQASGREVRAAADLYSLAIVLYEALTGVNPVRALPPAQRARRLAIHLPPVRRYRRDLPRELARAIDLALRPRPRERGSLEELRDALWRSLALVPDRPGVVEPPWRSRRTAEPEEEWSERWDAEPPSEREPRAGEGAARRWPQRTLAALAAGALAAWLAADLLAGKPLAPLGAGVIVAVAVVLFPRLGWIAAAATGCTALMLAGDAGAVLLLAPALLLPVMLLPHRPRSWPVAVMAPALAALGLAGAWPALAARASCVWQRAALGAVGWIWLLLAGPLAGAGLYTRLPHEIPSRAIWTTSAHEAARHVITPLLGSAMLAPALVWALGALILPGFTAPRSPRARITLAGAWSLILVLGSVSVLALAHAPASISFGQAALGALAGALLAAVPYGLR